MDRRCIFRSTVDLVRIGVRTGFRIGGGQTPGTGTVASGITAVLARELSVCVEVEDGARPKDRRRGRGGGGRLTTAGGEGARTVVWLATLGMLTG